MILSGGGWEGWLVSGFFGLCSLVSLAQLLIGPPKLVLDSTGWTIISWGRRTTRPWSDLAEIGTGRISHQKFVFFNLSSRANRNGWKLMRSANRKLINFDAMLPGTFGVKAEELAVVFTSWRDRFQSVAP